MQWQTFRNSFWLNLVTLSCVLSCGGSDETTTDIDTSTCTMAVVNSDYMSASVSLLDSHGVLCHDNLLHSGSTQPGLVTALSGDVIPATSPHPDGFITLIDRFPNGVISFVEPSTGAVVQQLSVAPGFAANPQDLVFLSGRRAYVSRAETNPTPTSEAGDLDDGADLVIVDLDTNALSGRIDLTVQASLDADGQPLNPRPGRMALHKDQVWVSLENLSHDFKNAGPGLVVLVDPATDTVSHRLELPGFQNCSRLLAVESGVWVTCSGNFGKSYDKQLAGSGLAFITMTAAGPTLSWHAKASDLGNRPLGYGTAAVGEHRLAYILVGDLDPANEIGDCIHLVDRRTSKAQNLQVKDTAYTIGDLAWLPEHSILMALVGNNEDPAIERRGLDLGGNVVKLTELPRVNTNPAVGLPPRTLGAYK